jgi:hypothetical protein
MMQGHVYECGSAMCHGGWYAIIRGANYYLTGAGLLAQDLGFAYSRGLEDWAALNPKIWGNKNGGSMFCSSSAFCKNAHITDLSQIIDHWKGVKKRALIARKIEK